MEIEVCPKNLPPGGDPVRQHDDYHFVSANPRKRLPEIEQA